MLLEFLRAVEIAQRDAAGAVGAIEAHAVVGLRAHAKGFGVAACRLAHDGAFAGDDPRGGDTSVEGCGRVLHVMLDGADGWIAAIDAAVAGNAIGPYRFVEREPEGLGERDDRLHLAEVVGLRRRLHLFELGLFLRVRGESGFIGLVGAGPESGAQGNGVVVDAGELDVTVASGSGVVGLVIADTHADARYARVAVLRTFAGAKGRACLVVVHVFNAVFDEIGLFKVGQLQMRHAAVEFLEHGFQNRIFFGIGARGLGQGGMRCEYSASQKSRGEEICNAASVLHCASFAEPVDAAPGMGRMGGRCVPCCWRCVSISLTSMAGATALTGTVPDSAPHSPLKTSGLSLVAMMRFMAARGVPTMLTPRTSSSGRPST